MTLELRQPRAFWRGSVMSVIELHGTISNGGDLAYGSSMAAARSSSWGFKDKRM